MKSDNDDGLAFAYIGIDVDGNVVTDGHGNIRVASESWWNDNFNVGVDVGLGRMVMRGNVAHNARTGEYDRVPVVATAAMR
jgi:hypothetical protein